MLNLFWLPGKEANKKTEESKEVELKTEIEFAVQESATSDNVARPLQPVEDIFSIDITTVSETTGNEETAPVFTEKFLTIIAARCTSFICF